MVIRGYRVGPLLKKPSQEIGEDKVGSLAAQTAYYFFFSLFPLFLFAAPLLSLVVDRATLMRLSMERVSAVVPPEAAAAVQLVLQNIVFVKNAPGLMSLGVLLAAWSGSNIFGALMDALNTAYDVQETRPGWTRQAIRLGLLGGGGIMILLTWMYYTMFVALAGGELASEMHHGTGATTPPKGATYFGRIVSGDHPGRPSAASGD